MNILFEDEGSFKAGHILADNNTSLQVELPGGKRVKVKASNVLLRFAQPGPAELLKNAEAFAAGMDTAFLWEACADDEFGFEEFAADYYGHTAAGAAEATALLLRLHAAPIYFHRKGKGRFRKAPPAILQAALTGQEKKRQQAQAVEHMVEALKAGQLPATFSSMLQQLLYKPDRNHLEARALETACAEAGLSAAALMQKCGAIGDTHEYHLGRFLFEYFPHGTDFPAFDEPSAIGDLPLAPVRAFSIDDAHTTEIDDAFSLSIGSDGSLTGYAAGVDKKKWLLKFEKDNSEVAQGELF